MKYKNARDILPKDLLREVKKYAAGTLLYIPSEEAERQELQHNQPMTDFKQGLLVRNQRIFNEFQSGKGINELADNYYLSLDTVKKIVYGKRKQWIPFNEDISTAIKYAASGLAEEWIRTYYLRKTGKDCSFCEEWICDGVLRFPLRLLDEVINVDYEIADTEPFLIHFSNHQFTYYGKRKLVESLYEQKRNSFPALIIIEDKKEYSYYYENYGKPFSRGHMNNY